MNITNDNINNWSCSLLIKQYVLLKIKKNWYNLTINTILMFVYLFYIWTKIIVSNVFYLVVSNRIASQSIELKFYI